VIQLPGARPDSAANPAGGFRSEDEIASLPGVRRIPEWPLAMSPSPDAYAFYRGTIQRSLYRIPIP
jgi:hypothetical protein